VSPCPYCDVSPDDAWAITEHAVAVPPAAPLTAGHVIVAPRRHVAGFYDLDVQEQRAVWDLVGAVLKQITESLKVDTVRIGFADAEPDGDGHACVHVVPNVPGGRLELPGGIEWVADDLRAG
jgi:diadenosine tetraphosphate (Ap4A) HIT family hydrolase